MKNNKPNLPPVGDAMSLYYRDLASFPPLSAEEERFLGNAIVLARQEEEHPHPRVQVMAKGKEASRRLIEGHLRQVVDIAETYHNPQVIGLTLADLIQYGNIGLMKAVSLFDPKQGRLSTFADEWIRQSIRDALADHTRLIRLPRYQVTNFSKMSRMQREVEEQTGRVPSLKEIASQLEMSVEDLARLQQEGQMPLSLTLCLDDDGEEREVFPLTPAPDEAARPPRSFLEKLLAPLTKRHRWVIEHLYGLGEDEVTYELDEVAQMLNLNRHSVKAVRRRAYEKLAQQPLPEMYQKKYPPTQK